jgi:hypothetical protein
MPKRTRSDKKFGVKVWVKTQDKLLFRSHCFQYHLSMMFVGEKYLITCLKEFPDSQLEYIIDRNLSTYTKFNSTRDGYETLGIHLTNEHWQKLAYFAVRYRTTVAKVASCLFEYCIGAYEVRGIEEEYGLTFNDNKRKRYKEKSREDINERVSDY